MFGEYLKNLKVKSPIIHSITNFVTANDCANILIAAGTSPIMANEYLEIPDIARVSSGLNINLGTINKNSACSIALAIKLANKLSHPVVVDPVGIGSSSYRRNYMKYLISNYEITAIRGNISEILTLTSDSSITSGVDARTEDKLNSKNYYKNIEVIKNYALKLDTIIVVSGEVDIITDGKTTYLVGNGSPMMAKVSGSGCMLSSIITAFLAANPDSPLEASVAAVAMMGVAGEKAHARMTEIDGNSSYRNYLIDAIFNITPEILENSAKIKYL